MPGFLGLCSLVNGKEFRIFWPRYVEIRALGGLWEVFEGFLTFYFFECALNVLWGARYFQVFRVFRGMA